MLRAKEKGKKEEIGSLLSYYKKTKTKIANRLRDFSEIKEKDWFYELCFCICTPQSKARRCDIAVNILKERDFMNKNFNPSKILAKNVRFHNHKAGYLVGLKNKFPKIREKIADAKRNSMDPKELREFLVREIKGIGYKEASHSLRNIGFGGLAILDRHILKNMLKFGAVSRLPKTLTKREYLGLEKELEAFSRRVKIDMDELDLLFWGMETGEVFK